MDNRLLQPISHHAVEMLSMFILSIPPLSLPSAKTSEQPDQPKPVEKAKLRASWELIDGKLICKWFSSPD
jgi:hypothetical protein